jgi:peroxiredoxin
MGTWCPNCLDESKYLANYYKNNKDKEFEIIGLAFEYTKTEDKAFENIERLKSRIDIEYPVLLAQYGSASKVSAQEKLPMLNHVLSYPTTIFIDKTGTVRKIHTGFNGPATGDKYTEFIGEFESFVNGLLEE